jgi:hypothetical protein
MTNKDGKEPCKSEPAAEYKHDTAHDGLQSKTFTWPDIKTGDCHQTGCTLTLISDGRGTFSCTTWTDQTHSGDVWQAIFTGQDRFKLDLFNVGAFNSPRMNSNPSPHYQWGGPFNYDKTKFDAIVGMVEHSWC